MTISRGVPDAAWHQSTFFDTFRETSYPRHRPTAGSSNQQAQPLRLPKWHGAAAWRRRTQLNWRCRNHHHAFRRTDSLADGLDRLSSEHAPCVLIFRASCGWDKVYGRRNPKRMYRLLAASSSQIVIVTSVVKVRKCSTSNGAECHPRVVNVSSKRLSNSRRTRSLIHATPYHPKTRLAGLWDIPVRSAACIIK